MFVSGAIHFNGNRDSYISVDTDSQYSAAQSLTILMTIKPIGTATFSPLLAFYDGEVEGLNLKHRPGGLTFDIVNTEGTVSMSVMISILYVRMCKS